MGVLAVSAAPDTARGASTRSPASQHTGLSKAHVSWTLCLWWQGYILLAYALPYGLSLIHI